MKINREADIVIVGAGIVGLFNALMYAKQGLQVVIIDNVVNQKRSYKVGESLLSYSNVFLRTLGELDSFANTSYTKLGVWFTNGMEWKKSFEDNTEWALSYQDSWFKEIMPNTLQYRACFHEKQLVRPEAEDFMQERVRSYSNVTFLDTALVDDVLIGDGEEPHEVKWICRETKESGSVAARWVIDCGGRRRLIATKMGHATDFGDDFQTTAVWAQFGNVLEEQFDDIWAYTYENGTRSMRQKHTCHLWGDGYWIWVIRLSNNRLSVGVTFDQNKQPAGAKPKDQFWDVMNRYPILTSLLKKEDMLEFRMYKDVQYTTDTFVSEKRYGMAGDAATIIDAYYSQGISMSLLTSFHIGNIVYEDVRQGRLNREYIDRVNRNLTQDWLIIRNFVLTKYTKAIEDHRFFILSHLLDNVILSSGIQLRWYFVRWMLNTNGDPAKESKLDAKLRTILQKKLFHSQASWSFASPEKIRSLQGYLQRKMGERARWRVENGVMTPHLKLLWPPLPKLSKLPFVGKKKLVNLTGKQISGKAAKLFIPKPETIVHRPFTAAVFVMLFQFFWAYGYDAFSTGKNKLLAAIGVGKSEKEQHRSHI
ncbi:FAD-dependent monooxygenase [Paenibacillus sp.]|jgi:2-polyprenyl-6-methoxyphenol hydroxylase-like FAD-dependent oxidoreductase|uniref:NAD(P)/FAD-dependent oxidoreductase n=1 Tax=Paenibacillus sp. TaxID=58172 RepID=UPI00281F027C|nr:FAD-dependent monooxygenase [Paenibacillus sp.]MDR0270482.1 tryptophan 7-halogenase [Paenibacillus sp.]